MRYSPLLLLAVPVLACAMSFEERVNAGYTSSESKLGRDYEASIGLFIGKVMRKCMPMNLPDNFSTEDFTLVSWVDDTGHVMKPDVQPSSALSNCFLTEFSKMDLPSPPKSGKQVEGYPLTIYMKIAE